MSKACVLCNRQLSFLDESFCLYCFNNLDLHNREISYYLLLDNRFTNVFKYLIDKKIIE